MGASEIFIGAPDGSLSRFQSTLAPVGASEFLCRDGPRGSISFQSTLAPVGASERTIIFWPLEMQCFNPRSHPWVRAKLVRQQIRQLFRVSIHARTRGCERIAAFVDWHVPFGVSIHARTRGCERIDPYTKADTGQVFQSTLAPVGASECCFARRWQRQYLFQSTLAPVGASESAQGTKTLIG